MNRITIPVDPPEELLESMGMRYTHDFGLLDPKTQESIKRQMKQLHEEVVGLGFYKYPEIYYREKI